MKQNPNYLIHRSWAKFFFWLMAVLITVVLPAHAFDLEYIKKGNNSFMSSDGRFVAFIGSNLIAATGETNQIYLYDRDLDTLKLISKADNGDSANQAVNLPDSGTQRAVSDDGRYVVFQTAATNLPGSPAVASSVKHIYLYDGMTGTISLVTKSSSGTLANFFNPADTGDFSIAPDGWAVMFSSSANNLDDNDTDNFSNAYLHEVSNQTTKLACFDRDGDKIDGNCKQLSLSCTGSMVFTSSSTTVVSELEDLWFGNDVFYGIPLNGTNTIISVGPSGEPADSNFHSAPSISCDGQRIAFATKASLTLNDTDADWDLYVHDLSTGVSHLLRGPSDTSFRPEKVTMSPNGTWIAFETKTQLDTIDTSSAAFTNVYSVFYSRNRLTLSIPKLISMDNGFVGNQISILPSVGDSGGVSFQSAASNFSPVDSNLDVFVNGCSPSMTKLNSDDVFDLQIVEACKILAANKIVRQLGDLTLIARSITLGSGFKVESGAKLQLNIL